MKKIYYKEGDVKFYALTISKDGCIISTTKDAARARVFNNDIFRDCDEYYKILGRRKASTSDKAAESKTGLQRELTIYQEE